MDNLLMRKIQLVDNWLETTYLIKVPFLWLKVRVEMVLRENPNQTVTDEQLNGFVFKCWLKSDLFDTACDKLPVIVDIPATKIEGSYNLQINKLEDISQSPYDQWLQLNGQINENVLVTADDFEAKKEKPSRVLKMEVTDGFKNMIAIERSLISTLSVNTKPGTKIRIHGVIDCWAGQLMLDKENVIVYGGEVESLMLKNCQYNILARLLGYPELPDPDKAVLTNNCVFLDETILEELQMNNEDEANFFDMNDFDQMIQNGEIDDVNEDPKNCDEPYTYLAKALASELTSSKIVYVKAFVGTLKGKLQKNYISNEYGLDVLINDGTMVAQASVSSSIIKDIIGLEPKEYRRNPEKGKAGLSKLANKMLMLNTIMKIELNPPPLPHKIISIEEDVERLNQLLIKYYNLDFSEIGLNV